METVTVSPKYQIVIPKALREEMKLVPGAKLNMHFDNGILQIMPDLPITAYRGFLRGMDVSKFKREKEDKI